MVRCADNGKVSDCGHCALTSLIMSARSSFSHDVPLPHCTVVNFEEGIKSSDVLKFYTFITELRDFLFLDN